MRPTVVIYDRLSRLFADEAPDHRVSACEAYAAQRGWDVVHIATDTNVSGATKLEDRPGMREVLSWLPRADYVLAAKLDRYARSVLEFQRLLRAADSTRTTIVTADGAVSPENASIVTNVLAAFAEYERDMITARITASKEHFRKRGNHLGGLAPYGYSVIGPVNDKRWAVDEAAATILRECANRLVNHGASLTGLAHELNERGVLSPADHARQRDGRPTRGTKWHLTTLIDARATGRGKQRSGKSLLLRLAVCSECGASMYRQRRIMGGKDYSTYVCTAAIGQRGIHRSNVINALWLEEHVSGEFLRRFGSFELMRWAEPDGSAVLQLSEVGDQIARLAGNLAQLDPNGMAARTAVGQLTALERRYSELEAEAAQQTGRWVEGQGSVSDERELDPAAAHLEAIAMVEEMDV